MDSGPQLQHTLPNQPSFRVHDSPTRKQWCFTLHYQDLGVDITLPSELPPTMTYLVFQQELTPTTERPHLQGFVCFSSVVRFTQVRTRLQAAFSTTRFPHIEYIRGSVAENVAYCTKEESRIPGTTPVELGERPRRTGSRTEGRKGQATRLARDLILKGMQPIEVLKDEDLEDAWGTALRLARTWNSLLAEATLHRNVDVSPTVFLFYGVPGAGKTRLAYSMFPKAYFKSPGKWWDHYHGEVEVIYDDFDGSSMTFGDFKRIFDRYPMLTEFKGGSSKLSSTIHIITTNVYPSHWWSKKVTGQDGRDAIWRRITQVWHFWSANYPAKVYDDPAEFRALPENFMLEQEDPKGGPE